MFRQSQRASRLALESRGGMATADALSAVLGSAGSLVRRRDPPLFSLASCFVHPGFRPQVQAPVPGSRGARFYVGCPLSPMNKPRPAPVKVCVTSVSARHLYFCFLPASDLFLPSPVFAGAPYPVLYVLLCRRDSLRARFIPSRQVYFTSRRFVLSQGNCKECTYIR
jgi:hypothetical protein